jgi:exodeoxyribonuclease VII large subunit
MRSAKSGSSLFGETSAPRAMTIAQVASLIKSALGTLPQTLYIQGELSNFKVSDRGHAYFTLKEPGAELPCICWKDAMARLQFRPKDGLGVIAMGTIKLYEPQGKIQLYVEDLIPKGVGALELAFRQLFEKLKSEGLFEQARKRPIPKLPQRVAIVTSRHGDVLHDVLTTALRRYPGLHAALFPVRVQGDGAADEIAGAIRQLNAHNKNLSDPFDLILLVRGGGSLEDLWAFNDETLARTIAASKIPIATGIGHEPDITIADLVGDLRGPTPTGVTELTIPDTRALSREIAGKASSLTRHLSHSLRSAAAHLRLQRTHMTAVANRTLQTQRKRVNQLADLVQRIEPRHAIAQSWRRIEELQRKLTRVSLAKLQSARTRLAKLETRLERLNPASAVKRAADRTANLQAKLTRALLTRAAITSQRLESLARHLQSVGPQSVLERGYSITTAQDGKIIRSKSQVSTGDLITTKVADGEIKSTVGQPRQSKLF